MNVCTYYSYYEKIGNNASVLEEIPEIPTTWVYCRFKDVVNYYLGKTPPRSATEYWGNDISWVSIADMIDNGVITVTKEKLSSVAAPLFKNKISLRGTLLMSFKLTVGRVSILGIDAAHNEAIISIFPYYDVEEKFRNYLFKFLPNIANSGDSKDAIKGTTLNSSSINNLLIPIPPINEQAQIIVAVDRLNEKIAQLSQ
ncbi:MAG: restriction endonuclease subunit S [Streptococcaceae bacterium]|jgi:type I restriction enzyme S subunit|nr:restriction endonuclease subunit S [Streptococcaceae bacterium]